MMSVIYKKVVLFITRLCSIIKYVFVKTGKFFWYGQYRKILFYTLGFSKKDFTTFALLSRNKKRFQTTWYFNNLIFPLIVIFLPYLLTTLHYTGADVVFNKGVVDIILGGSLSLLGLNVVRNASTYITERLDESKVPPELKDKLPVLTSKISDVKGKLKNWVFGITVAGTFCYFIQAGQLLKSNNQAVEYYLIGIFVISGLSLFIGRFAYLVETNYLENGPMIEVLFEKLVTQADDRQALLEDINLRGL